MDPDQLQYGTLFVVATPIGNRDDISPRARQVLAHVDLIAAEDTRHTGRLLSHFGIKSRLLALHEHNENEAFSEVILQLKNGKSVALVSDAGTPLVSDPGFRLIHEAHQHEIPVSPIPGPSAFVAALSVCGLPVDRVCFEGFLPAKAAARRKRLQALASESRTTVFFESVHRVGATVADLVASHGGDRAAFLGRELTKLHEQCVSATLAEIAALLGDGRIPAKGEFVLVVAGADEAPDGTVKIDINELLARLVEAMPGKQAVSLAADISGHGRNELYQRMLAMNSKSKDDK